MPKYLIEGGNRLKGKVKISGNKNAILPCLSACLLTDEEVTLENVPLISDVKVMCELLEHLGAEVILGEAQVKITAGKITTTDLPLDLVNKLRASVLLVGPLLAKAGKVKFLHPGGDIIGKRSIDTHLKCLKQLGFKISSDDRNYKGSKGLGFGGDKTIFMDEPSVTATENLIMASSLHPGKVVLKNAAYEPHIVDLCQMLISMGAKIEGVGTSTLTIDGVKKLSGTNFKVSQDYIEIGTYAIASAITQGEIKLINCTLQDLEPITNSLSKMGVEFREDKEGVLVKASSLHSIPRLTTNIWPGFPTDLMSAVIVLATQARGASLLHDWMYESRMFFVDKLISMGANITIADPHRVFVYGPTKLVARELESPDIRAGMALVLAALIAKGQSIINKAELIERGYEDVVGNLSRLGAKIERID